MQSVRNIRLSTVFCAAVAIVVPSVCMAQAQEAGWYLGGSIGQSQAKDACSGLAGTGISCDDKDTAWKILGGYQVNRYVAAEFGYTDLGKVSASAFGLTDEIKTTAWELTAVGSLPLAERFSLFGRLGLYRAEVKESTNFVGNFKATSTDLTFGLGARYDISKNLGIRGEWQKYKDVGGGDIGKSDIDVISLGVIWNFR